MKKKFKKKLAKKGNEISDHLYLKVRSLLRGTRAVVRSS